MKNLNENVSVPHFSLFVTIAAAIFVGGSGTVLVHHVLAPSESQRHVEESTGSVVVDPRLAEAMNQIAKELHEMRSATASSPTPSDEPSHRSVAADSGDSALVELAAAVRELRGALQHGSPGQSAANPSPPVLPRIDQRAWLPELPSGTTDRDHSYTRQHLFWTEQQVLDQYGIPDEIGSGEGLEYWYYRDEPTGKRSFTIMMSQGRVIQVQTQ